jgi:hypothetical protein
MLAVLEGKKIIRAIRATFALAPLPLRMVWCTVLALTARHGLEAATIRENAEPHNFWPCCYCFVFVNMKFLYKNTQNYGMSNTFVVREEYFTEGSRRQA